MYIFVYLFKLDSTKKNLNQLKLTKFMKFIKAFLNSNLASIKFDLPIENVNFT